MNYWDLADRAKLLAADRKMHLNRLLNKYYPEAVLTDELEEYARALLAKIYKAAIETALTWDELVYKLEMSEDTRQLGKELLGSIEICEYFITITGLKCSTTR